NAHPSVSTPYVPTTVPNATLNPSGVTCSCDAAWHAGCALAAVAGSAGSAGSAGMPTGKFVAAPLVAPVARCRPGPPCLPLLDRCRNGEQRHHRNSDEHARRRTPFPHPWSPLHASAEVRNYAGYRRNWAVSVSLVHRFWRSWPSYRATHDRQNEVLGDQHYAADGLAAFDEGVGGGCVREREGAVYEDLQAAGRDVVDVALDHLARAVVGDLGAEEDAGQRLVAHHQHRGVERLRIAAGLADEAAAASVGERLDAADQHLAADRIDDEVDAPAIGGGSHLVDPTALGVVDGDVEAEVLQGLEAFEARRCRQHPRAGALGQLDGGHTDPAGAGLDKDGLTFFQAPELEEAIIGGAEGDGYARTGHDVGAVGDGPRDDRGNGDPLGV